MGKLIIFVLQILSTSFGFAFMNLALIERKHKDWLYSYQFSIISHNALWTIERSKTDKMQIFPISTLFSFLSFLSTLIKFIYWLLSNKMSNFTEDGINDGFHKWIATLLGGWILQKTEMIPNYQYEHKLEPHLTKCWN